VLHGEKKRSFQSHDNEQTDENVTCANRLLFLIIINIIRCPGETIRFSKVTRRRAHRTANRRGTSFCDVLVFGHRRRRRRRLGGISGWGWVYMANRVCACVATVRKNKTRNRLTTRESRVVLITSAGGRGTRKLENWSVRARMSERGYVRGGARAQRRTRTQSQKSTRKRFPGNGNRSPPPPRPTSTWIDSRPRPSPGVCAARSADVRPPSRSAAPNRFCAPTTVGPVFGLFFSDVPAAGRRTGTFSAPVTLSSRRTLRGPSAAEPPRARAAVRDTLNR